jgi:hypothetical protein
MPTMLDQQIFIKKANGERELFNVDKLRHSLEKSKASAAIAEQVAGLVVKEIEDGMTTHQIYEHAFKLLHELERPVAIRYSLRRALLALGPTGFPFERFVAEIFKSRGYQTLTDQTVLGHCVEHEVDVIAWKPATGATELVMSEVKFHNELGLKSDLQVVLYVKARFEDLGENTFTYGGSTLPLGASYLFTNTKFTSSAIKYAECQGMNIVGWNYPVTGNIQDMIEAASLHPLTCLHSLSDHDKKDLISRGLVLCKNLQEKPEYLRDLGLSGANIDAVLDEISHITMV